MELLILMQEVVEQQKCLIVLLDFASICCLDVVLMDINCKYGSPLSYQTKNSISNIRVSSVISGGQ